jgi:hypothetical protein
MQWDCVIVMEAPVEGVEKPDDVLDNVAVKAFG